MRAATDADNTRDGPNPEQGVDHAQGCPKDYHEPR
jgi:hypothetical protein